jgi:septum formation inhibitor-activating ATPase MinD
MFAKPLFQAQDVVNMDNVWEVLEFPLVNVIPDGQVKIVLMKQCHLLSNPKVMSNML